VIAKADDGKDKAAKHWDGVAESALRHWILSAGLRLPGTRLERCFKRDRVPPCRGVVLLSAHWIAKGEPMPIPSTWRQRSLEARMPIFGAERPASGT
jgi:hypothetical protein